MKTEFQIIIDQDVANKFDMALLLTGEDRDEVLEAMMKDYIAIQFSQAAMSMGAGSKKIEKELMNHNVGNYGKALKKIPKWATKQTQMPYRIVRAFLQLEQKSPYVKLADLEKHCSDEINHPDVYVKMFSLNFTQMKLDSEKSHGKVFEIDSEGIVHLWSYVENAIRSRADDFLVLHSTDIGYVNDLNQQNLGKTDKKGTGYGQMLYEMKCLDCGHIYYANGHDIFLKKCPKCQGGADTGNS